MPIDDRERTTPMTTIVPSGDLRELAKNSSM